MEVIGINGVAGENGATQMPKRGELVATKPQRKNPPPPPPIAAANNFYHNHSLYKHTFKAKDHISCKICSKHISGEAYGCNKFLCKFFIHESCFRIPKQIKHPSHSTYSLTLRAHYPSGKFICNACGGTGDAFHYHSVDNFDLHVNCAALPDYVKHSNHTNRLKLHYDFPLHRESSAVKCKIINNKVE
ncbi:hypothetical protein LguiA_033368 [Lonicera macranthoides]